MVRNNAYLSAMAAFNNHNLRVFLRPKITRNTALSVVHRDHSAAYCLGMYVRSRNKDSIIRRCYT